MNDGFKPSRFVFNALMNGYAKIGDIKSKATCSIVVTRGTTSHA